LTQPTLHHFGQVIHHGDPQAQSELRRPGHCTLLGVGQGDPGLLTASTINTIKTATVLLVDDQVSEAVVALAPPTARVVRVGRRPLNRATAQAFVEKIIIMAVREGNSVVHIKAGDPIGTGYAGEEITHLQAAGVSVVLGDMPLGFLALKMSQNKPIKPH
jgi:uroporphyrin-III C-methyltransferase